MKSSLSTKAAILNALLEGPRYGQDLIRLLNERARSLVHARPGTVYRAAEALVQQRHVRTWTVVPGGARGARSRRYYELTAKGISAAETQRAALQRLFGAHRAPTSPVGEIAMRQRLRRAGDLRAFVRKLQRGLRGER